MSSPLFSTYQCYKHGTILSSKWSEHMGTLISSRPGYKPFLTWFLVLSIAYASVVYTAAYAISKNETDRLALLEFKAKVTADPLGILSSWNDTTHFCKWFGITCSKRHQRVTQLFLSSMQLGGSISPHIGNLTFLRIVGLDNNNFINKIPSEIGYLRRLKILYLSNNSLTGEIPSNLSRCTELVSLGVAFNSLVGEIPREFGLLSKLQFLSMHMNHLTGDIHPLGNTSSLVSLSATVNNFSGSIPDAFGRLQQLSFLGLAQNHLSGTFPPSIFNLSSLTVLSVADNHLEGYLPSDLFITLPNLYHLTIWINQFTGPIPTSLSNASNLQTFELQTNFFTGNVPSLQKLNVLNDFNIERNSIGTRGPNDLNFLCSLTNATNLEELDISSNNFGGSLPECINDLTSELIAFWLRDNHISGNIPASIPNFVVYFSVGKNNLHGRIPQSLCNTTRLHVLDLGNNHLKGRVPDCLIAGTRTLGVLDLRGNNIGGTIPDRFGKNCTLETLDISENFVQGHIPRSLANCKGLKVLDLGNNQLKDTFPCELSTLSELQVLILKSNRFSGPVACPGKDLIWPLLQILNLASNFFSGEIPAQLISKWRLMMTGTKELQTTPDLLQYYAKVLDVFIYYEDTITLTFKNNDFELQKVLKIFTSIDLSSNAFHGEIPKELGNLNALIVLNLSHNSLSGNIPSSFGNLSELESLDLSCNALSGNIPQELANLNFLEYLNLSFNKLVGPIPTSTQLQSFNVSSYQGNPGLYGPPLTQRDVPTRSTPPSSPDGSHWSFKSEVEWMLRGAEVGFPVGLAVFIGPLLYIKRWKRWYCKHLGRLAIKILGRKDRERAETRRRNTRLQQQRR